MSGSMDALRQFEREKAEAYKRLAEEANPTQGNRPWAKKLRSEALAVHPDLIPEAVDDAKKKGVPTDFDHHGRPVFQDRNHRKRYMKAYGYIDKSGGYGDAQTGQTELNHQPVPVPEYTDAPLDFRHHDRSIFR